MRRYLAVALSLFLGCDLPIKPPRPADPPDPTCPDTCPAGTACTDPKKGCEEIPAPGPVCEVGKQDCQCYVRPPETGVWELMTCPTGKQCVDKVCKQPPDPEPRCREGQNCACWVLLEITGDWRLMSCSPPNTCVDFVCKAPEEPQPPSSCTSVCPKALAPGASISMRNSKYGASQLDSTLIIKGDPELCFIVHGQRVNECHLEGWNPRSECEMCLIGERVGKARACPVAQYDVGAGFKPCLDAPNPEMNCDHWGSVNNRLDDPQTPAFEGWPIECGNQRSPDGRPMAGFATIPHGKGRVRFCLPDYTGCATGVGIDKSLPEAK